MNTKRGKFSWRSMSRRHFALVLTWAALAFLAFSSSAQGAPVHLFLTDHSLLDGSKPPISEIPQGELNKACGTAVDSEGDLYVASAGKGYIDIFRPSGNSQAPWEYLTSVQNLNEPCGLAVDSQGRLYASESTTGNVVAYVPQVYPPQVGTAYVPDPVPVDVSGEAKGIAVDPFDDRLYVARGGEIASYQPDGTTGQNEVQTILISMAASGTITLTFEGATTGPIAAGSPHSDPNTPGVIDSVQEVLEALPTIGANNVSVEEAPGGERHHAVRFENALGSANVGKLKADASGLSGGSVFIDTPIEGFAFDGLIGDEELVSASGVTAYTNATGNPFKVNFEGDRYVAVADDSNDTIEIFSGNAITDLVPRRTIDGSQTPDGDIGFGPAGAQLTSDWSNGHLSIYDHANASVHEFEASGAYVTSVDHTDFTDAEPSGLAAYPHRDEVQGISVVAAGGEFKLSFQGEQTEDFIPYDAAGSQVEAALEDLPSIGDGNVVVSGGGLSGGFPLPLRVRFTGSLAKRNVLRLEADSSGLTGATASRADIGVIVEGAGPGRLYVGVGGGPGAKVLAFGPLTSPSRGLRPDLSLQQAGVRAVDVDPHGDRYVATDSAVSIYQPSSQKVVEIEGPQGAAKLSLSGENHTINDLAVDSSCNVYVLDFKPSSAEQRFAYFAPEAGACPPKNGTKYTGPHPIIGRDDFPGGGTDLQAIAVSPINGHLFVSNANRIMELDSVAKGLATLDSNFGGETGIAGPVKSMDVCGSSENVYASAGSGNSRIYVLDSTGKELLTQITGRDSTEGSPLGAVAIAVDQSNCHVIAFEGNRGVAEEYEASGAFVAEFGLFTEAFKPYGIAIDNGVGSPNRGIAYVAYDDSESDVTAFDPLAYGESPKAITGIASKVNAGSATLNGTVNPRGSMLDNCHFEYLSELDYDANAEGGKDPFDGAVSEPCVEDLSEIGKGTKFVPVHAVISGLEADLRYRYRLIASNEFGQDKGEAGILGPPRVEGGSAQPVSYTEATLRATVDPSGLTTTYHFQYGASEAYGQQTAAVILAPDAGPTEVEVPIFGLAEGTTYHFRAVAGNEVSKAVFGPNATLTTLKHPASETKCSNVVYRTGPSADLPDCRAYELVSPADTGGAILFGSRAGAGNWQVAPYGEQAGESITFLTSKTLPGFEGAGEADGYRGKRAQGEGMHPAAGWLTELYGPSYAEAGGAPPNAGAISSDQRYWFFGMSPNPLLEEGALKGTYLRTPTGFESAAQGSLGADLNAQSHFVAPNATHVIFRSNVQLEDSAPPAIRTLYDRTPSGTYVVSLPPADASGIEKEAFKANDATYIAATEDGAKVVFEVGGALYLRRNNETTVKVAAAPNTFAGISDDGEHVFYANADLPELTTAPTELFVFEAKAQTHSKITSDSAFVHVSADGSAVYFTSEKVLDADEKGVENKQNLYFWDGFEIHFVAILHSSDFSGFHGTTTHLGRWTLALRGGRADSPTRSTPDGSVFLFQSHAQLTDYNNEGFGEIYRYEPTAAPAEQLLCISCDPGGVAPSGDDILQGTREESAPAHVSTLIPNLTEDGRTIFFQSEDGLLPEDANSAQDVYEWDANGTDGCQLSSGCLALISSGQGERDSLLYGMTVDGSDVFFHTFEKLHGKDISGSPSIYDARIEGGIPDPPAPAPCQGDACQGLGSTPPTLHTPASTGSGVGNVVRKCRKGTRPVKRRGKIHCVKRRHSRPRRASRRDRSLAGKRRTTR